MRKGGLKTGNILFTNRGEIGKVAIVDEKFSGANLNSQIAYLNPLDENKVNNKFLLYSLASQFVRSQIDSISNGSVLTQFPLRDVGELQVCIPPLDEQLEIS